MKHSWFMRLLFSYLPVFFIIISLLVSIFVFSLAEITKNAANAIDQGTTEHVMQMVDNALENTEFDFIRILDSNLDSSRELQNFFTVSESDLLHSSIIPSSRLGELTVENPLIDSVYMVRWSDERVLVNDTSTYLDNFEDKNFVEEFRRTKNYGSWSEQRTYRTFNTENLTNVVSLVQPYPVMNGDLGIIVINLRVSSIINFVHNIASPHILETQLIDQENRIFQRSTTDYNKLDVDHINGKVISQKTGWKLYTEIHGNLYLQYADKLIFVLWMSGTIAVIGAILYIIYVTRKNYKPIVKLAGQIENYSLKQAEQLIKRMEKDEFTYIEKAIDKIIEQSDEFLQQKEEHLKQEKKLCLKALLEGQFEMITKELPKIEQLFGWPLRESKHVVIAVEIDKYIGFQKHNSRRDQSLLKFLIMNVFNEVMLQHRLQFEGDWVLPNLWVAIVAKPKDNETLLQDVIEKILAWINEKLDFTITFGVGEEAEKIQDIHVAYERSLEMLQYKSSLGGNRVIGYWDIPNPDDVNPVTSMLQIQQIANLFRSQDQEWKTAYHAFIEDLQNQLLNREDSWYLLNYFIYQLSADIYALSNEYRKIWDQQILPRIQVLMSDADTLEDIEQPLKELLENAEQEFSIIRQCRTYSATMQRVKEYIEEHHSNPQLSLNLLSECFHLSPNYLSHLFKEETGEKFVDYLTKVRMAQAKKLLHLTDDSVQNIAERVGYNHAFSFIRAFKKLVGFTPGDFRRNVQENNDGQ